MAILEEQFTETLDAGAPDITYEGSEGREQQIAQALWDKLPPQVRMQFGSFQQFFSSGAWKKVLEMLQQQMQGREGQQEVQDPRLQQEGQAVQDQGMMDQGIGGLMPQAQPMGMAYGGTPGADGRRQYGIGSWFQKKIMDPIKKNPLKSAAAAYGLYSLGGGEWGIPGIGSGEGFDIKNLNPLKYLNKGLDRDNPNEMKNLKTWGQTLMNPNFLIPAASLISGAFAKPDEPGYTGQGTGLNIADIGKLANISDPQVGQAAGLRFLPDVETRKFTPEQMAATYAGSAQGGRIGYGSGTASPDPNRVAPEGDLKTNLLNVFANKFGGRKTASPHPNRVVPEGDPKENLLNVFANKFAGRKQVQPLLGGQVRSGDDFMANMISQSPVGREQLTSLQSPGYKLQQDFSRYRATGGNLNFKDWLSRQQRAHGGRIRAQEGGLMDLGGMEKDYRNDGGFVPIGGEEKADDVPARLSRNEFVFTADAVRNAGGGDMDRGAEVMENVMKNLEDGGRISDESQGKGAGEMFEVSERLSEVV